MLPLDAGKLKSIALIGPLADAPYEQLGTWIFDGDPDLSVTPLQAIHDIAGDDFDVQFVPVGAVKLDTHSTRQVLRRGSESAAARAPGQSAGDAFLEDHGDEDH